MERGGCSPRAPRCSCRRCCSSAEVTPPPRPGNFPSYYFFFFYYFFFLNFIPNPPSLSFSPLSPLCFSERGSLRCPLRVGGHREVGGRSWGSASAGEGAVGSAPGTRSSAAVEGFLVITCNEIGVTRVGSGPWRGGGGVKASYASPLRFQPPLPVRKELPEQLRAVRPPQPLGAGRLQNSGAAVARRSARPRHGETSQRTRGGKQSGGARGGTAGRGEAMCGEGSCGAQRALSLPEV